GSEPSFRSPGHRAGPPFWRLSRFAGLSALARETPSTAVQRNRYRGEFMATATQSATPTRDDFAQMLEESFTQGSPQEGAVVTSIVVVVEKDLAVLDLGAKTEGRVALRECAAPGRQADIKVGDTVE